MDSIMVIAIAIMIDNAIAWKLGSDFYFAADSVKACS